MFKSSDLKGKSFSDDDDGEGKRGEKMYVNVSASTRYSHLHGEQQADTFFGDSNSRSLSWLTIGDASQGPLSMIKAFCLQKGARAERKLLMNTNTNNFLPYLSFSLSSPRQRRGRSQKEL